MNILRSKQRTAAGLAGLLLAVGLATTAPLLLSQSAPIAHSSADEPTVTKELNGTGAGCTSTVCNPAFQI
jgi:hypothetical protein